MSTLLLRLAVVIDFKVCCICIASFSCALITTQPSRLELRRYCFSVGVFKIKWWNALAEAVMASPSVKVFE